MTQSIETKQQEIKMLTNDIKKGTRIQLKNGWYGTMMDNMKGNIRMAEVEGYCTEIGSVYAWDIAHVINPDGTTVPVTLTEKQLVSQRISGVFN